MDDGRGVIASYRNETGETGWPRGSGNSIRPLCEKDEGTGVGSPRERPYQ